MQWKDRVNGRAGERSFKECVHARREEEEVEEGQKSIPTFEW